MGKEEVEFYTKLFIERNIIMKLIFMEIGYSLRNGNYKVENERPKMIWVISVFIIQYQKYNILILVR